MKYNEFDTLKLEVESVISEMKAVNEAAVSTLESLVEKIEYCEHQKEYLKGILEAQESKVNDENASLKAKLSVAMKENNELHKRVQSLEEELKKEDLKKEDLKKEDLKKEDRSEQRPNYSSKLQAAVEESERAARLMNGKIVKVNRDLERYLNSLGFTIVYLDSEYR